MTLGASARRRAAAAAGGLAALAGLACALRACAGPDLRFRRALWLERGGRPLEAVRSFSDFVARFGADPRAGEAAYRAGRLYAESLGRCREAVPYFERAARAGVEPFAEDARRSLLSCPDFFPLSAGARWTYVDTLSGGQNMRLELGVRVSSANLGGRIGGSFYAGAEKFRDYDRAYEKRGWAVWETVDGAAEPILRYPFRAGRSWRHRGKAGWTEYSIEADGLAVRTRGGEFAGCVKVRERQGGAPSWVYQYYCPGVGRVKTTVGVPGAENPNTELDKFLPPGSV